MLELRGLRPGRRTCVVAAAVVVVGFGVAGCSGEPLADGAPCDQFSVGDDVDDDVTGCVDSNGNRERLLRFECLTGPPIITFPQEMWVRESTVVTGPDDELERDVEECLGKPAPGAGN